MIHKSISLKYVVGAVGSAAYDVTLEDEWSTEDGQKVFIKSFCKSQFPHKSVHLSFIITNVQHKLTDLCGN